MTKTDNQPPAKKQKLSSKEIEDIMDNELSDIHINMAQTLLKVQFALLNGLKSTLLQGKQQTF